MTLQSTLAAFPYISMDWASNLELLGRNLSKPFPGQAAQVLGCLQLHIGEGEAVHDLRILGIDLQGATQIVESPQAVSLLAEDGAQVLEGHGIPVAWACMVHSLARRRSPARW